MEKWSKATLENHFIANICFVSCSVQSSGLIALNHDWKMAPIICLDFGVKRELSALTKNCVLDYEIRTIFWPI